MCQLRSGSGLRAIVINWSIWTFGSLLIDMRADSIMTEFIIQHLAALGRMAAADCFWVKPRSKSNRVAVAVAYVRAICASGMNRI